MDAGSERVSWPSVLCLRGRLHNAPMLLGPYYLYQFSLGNGFPDIQSGDAGPTAGPKP